MSKPSHHRLSSFPVLRSLLDECRTEHELRSVCTRISTVLSASADREDLVTYFHHLKGRGIGEQGEQTILKGGSKGYGKGSKGYDEGKGQGQGNGYNEGQGKGKT